MVLGDIALFAADDGEHGEELWRSDGTEAGTALVADIAGGAAGSDPRQLTRLGTTVFFTADEGSFGEELWKTDGTGQGTAPITDINPGPDSASPRQLTAVGGARLSSPPLTASTVSSSGPATGRRAGRTW